MLFVCVEDMGHKSETVGQLILLQSCHCHAGGHFVEEEGLGLGLGRLAL